MRSGCSSNTGAFAAFTTLIALLAASASAQNTIQAQVSGSPHTNQAASFIMVVGNGTGRAGKGNQRNFTYHCSMHANGNVADSRYNITGGTPQPR